jgi:hypothetical protein
MTKKFIGGLNLMLSIVGDFPGRTAVCDNKLPLLGNESGKAKFSIQKNSDTLL